MSLQSIVRHFYEVNQRHALYIRLRNASVQQLYHTARNVVNHNTPFFSRVNHLFRLNQRYVLNIRRNHPFIRALYNDCNKLFSTQTYDKNKKAALLIGINYKGTKNELRGCENDVYATKKVLIEQYGFKTENIRILSEKENKDHQPTRANILLGMQWLVQKGDSGFGTLWFQYSGHGFYIKDKDGDEKDGKDECIVTCDNYPILDDEFKSLLVNNLHKHVNLFCLMDCCHSGTMLDLKYKYRNKITTVESTRKAAECRVVALSGCRDDQTSADAWFNGNFAGALTKTFLDVIKSNKYHNIPVFHMVESIRNGLKKGRFEQIPQLTCSIPLSHSSKFNM